MLHGRNKGSCLFSSASACWDWEQSLSEDCAVLLLPILICYTAEPVARGTVNVEGTGSCPGCHITSWGLCQDPYQPNYASLSAFLALLFYILITGITPNSMSGSNRNVILFYLWLAHLLGSKMFQSLSFHHHPGFFGALSFDLFTLSV